MPYSRAKEKRLARETKWPDLRYSPTGEAKLFYAAADVPAGWSQRAPIIRTLWKPPELLDRAELIRQLTDKGITINPTWADAHMKRILDGDISPPR